MLLKLDMILSMFLVYGDHARSHNGVTQVLVVDFHHNLPSSRLQIQFQEVIAAPTPALTVCLGTSLVFLSTSLA